MNFLPPTDVVASTGQSKTAPPPNSALGEPCGSTGSDSQTGRADGAGCSIRPAVRPAFQHRGFERPGSGAVKDPLRSPPRAWFLVRTRRCPPPPLTAALLSWALATGTVTGSRGPLRIAGGPSTGGTGDAGEPPGLPPVPPSNDQHDTRGTAVTVMPSMFNRLPVNACRGGLDGVTRAAGIGKPPGLGEEPATRSPGSPGSPGSPRGFLAGPVAGIGAGRGVFDRGDGSGRVRCGRRDGDLDVVARAG